MSKGYDATGFSSMYADIYCNLPDVRGFDSIQVYDKGLFDGKTVPQNEMINKIADIKGDPADYVVFKSQSTDAVRFVNHLFANDANVWMLVENVVAQMLRAAGRDLFFHKVCDRVDGRNRIEIEFLLSKTPTTARHNVIPIEVKSNNDYTTVSLERFKEKFPGYCAERYVLHPGNADFTGDIKYLPLYMTPLLVNRRGRI